MKQAKDWEIPAGLIFMIACCSIAVGCAVVKKIEPLPDGELPKTLEQCQDVFIDRNDQIYLLKLEVKQLKEELDAQSKRKQ
jgi:hypothetical protein